MRLSTRRSTPRRGSPEHFRQANHKSEVALEGSSALEDRSRRVDRSGADSDEVGERDAELDGGVVAGASARASPTARDVDRPSQRWGAGRLAPELVDDPSLEATGGVRVEANRHHAEHRPLRQAGAEPPLESGVIGSAHELGE